MKEFKWFREIQTVTVGHVLLPSPEVHEALFKYLMSVRGSIDSNIYVYSGKGNARSCSIALRGKQLLRLWLYSHACMSLELCFEVYGYSNPVNVINYVYLRYNWSPDNTCVGIVYHCGTT